MDIYVIIDIVTNKILDKSRKHLFFYKTKINTGGKDITMKQDESLLDKLYNGNLELSAMPVYKTEQYKSDEKELLEIRKKLEKILGEENMEILDDYITLSLTISSYVSQEKLKDGVVLGILLSEELEERKQKFI